MAGCQSESLHWGAPTTTSPVAPSESLQSHLTVSEDSHNNICRAAQWMADCQSKIVHRRAPTTTSVALLRSLALRHCVVSSKVFSLPHMKWDGCLLHSRSYPNLIRLLSSRSLPNLIRFLRKSPASMWRRAPQHELSGQLRLILIACHFSEVACNTTQSPFATCVVSFDVW